MVNVASSGVQPPPLFTNLNIHTTLSRNIQAPPGACNGRVPCCSGCDNRVDYSREHTPIHGPPVRPWTSSITRLRPRTHPRVSGLHDTCASSKARLVGTIAGPTTDSVPHKPGAAVAQVFSSAVRWGLIAIVVCARSLAHGQTFF